MSPSEIAEGLQNWVRGLRATRGLTQEELTRAAGLTRQRIIAIEKGRFTPSIATALTLAAALDAAVDALFWLEDKNRVQG